MFQNLKILFVSAFVLLGLVSISSPLIAKGISSSQIKRNMKKYKQRHGSGTDTVDTDKKDVVSPTVGTQDGTFEIGKTDLKDYEPGKEPKEGKPVPQILLESIKLADKSNLAFAVTADMTLLYQLRVWLKKQGKQNENLLEEVLKVYATNGKKDWKTLTRYLKEMIVGSNFPSQASINREGLQGLVDHFFVHPRVGHFSLTPGVREIVRSQLRSLVGITKGYVKDFPKLKELNKNILEGLRIDAHDLYLVVLLSDSLEIARNITTKKFKPMLLNRLSKNSTLSLQTLQWSSDQLGAYTVR